MMIKVILLRRVPPAREPELRPLLVKLRGLAMTQHGYISGETLMNADNPEEYLVISSWQSMEDWNAWLAKEERREVQQQIDDLLGSETLYQVYYHL
jgi:heme-degrading monooxygenase HmoA